MAAAAKPKPKPPRKPEDVWKDVHKHPDGVPGGMGLSPEHHLRNRGWMGHEINEGSGKKTIQYRHHEYPNFVISYGGGSGTKPDHNFRIMHMGTNPHVPRVTRAYSLAEAMNKVEELHGLNSGLVVQPMTHDSAAAPAPVKPPSQQAPALPAVPKPAKPRDMTKADSYPEFPEQPEHTETWRNPNRDFLLRQIPITPSGAGGNKPGSGVHVADFSGAASALKMAQRATWENDDDDPSWDGDDTDYYHGTTEEDLGEVSPATSHLRGVIFPHQTDPEYAYATPSERNAWHYAELAWNATDHGIPRVYRVRPTGPVEEDPTHWPNGESRGNFSGDVRSRHPFEVHEELPTPEHWQRDDEDWEG